VSVAGADLSGDGLADIVTGAGAGAPGGHVKVFNGQDGSLVHSFLAFPGDFSGGVYVAATSIPAPGTLAFVGIAALGLGRRRR
jgi:uncharacterized protein (TIGR03382 family)